MRTPTGRAYRAGPESDPLCGELFPGGSPSLPASALSMSVVPPDLWERLARVNNACVVRTQTVFVPDGAGDWEMRWRVTVRTRAGDEQVIAEHSKLVLALADALALVEARGWHR